MDRLLVLRLESQGVAAEAVLNGVPVARKTAAAPTLTVPVHEYTLAGANRIELVVEPAPATAAAPPAPKPRLGDGRSFARARLLLPRNGQRAHPEFARTLAQLEWAALEGEATAMPHGLESTVELPIVFPRWRWLDVPPVADAGALLPAALGLVHAVALGLARGDPEPFVQAARLLRRTGRGAYQRPLADEIGRFRVHVQRLHAEAPLLPLLPTADTLNLRPLAGGRLFECLLPDAQPALAVQRAGGMRIEWPLLLAPIEGRMYVLR